MKKIILIGLCLFAFNTIQAQVKIGYFDLNYVFPQLPESKQAEADLKAYGNKLKKELEDKEKEFQTKLDTYQKTATTMTEISRQASEKELQQLQQAYQELQGNAQKSLQEKESKMLEPIYAKIEKAINEVAKENTYTYVLRKESLLYEPEDNSGNISDLVLKKLGITPAPKTTTTGTTPKK